MKLTSFALAFIIASASASGNSCDSSNPGSTSSCCTITNQCGVGEGDCDIDSDCIGDLTCGVDNCLTYFGWGPNLHDCCGSNQCDASNRGSTGSCCTISNQCGVGEGDCDIDSDCIGDLTCGVDNCLPDYGWGISTHDCCESRWDIDFKNLSVNFASTNTADPQVTIKYDIAKRDYKTFLFANKDGECTQEPDSDLVIDNPVIYESVARSEPVDDGVYYSHDKLELTYRLNMTNLEGSNIWDSTNTKMELCQKVQLTEDVPGEDEYMVITEDIRNITVEFEMDANFTTAVALNGATIQSNAQNSSLDDYIVAYMCDSIGVKSADNAKLSPNQILNICVQSLSRDIQIASVDSMKIVGKNPSGEDEDMNVITVEGGIVYDAITTKNIVNESTEGMLPEAIISTLVPVNLISFEPTEANPTPSIDVSGSIALMFAGTSGRKLTVGRFQNRQLQVSNDANEDSAAFDVSVSLQPEDKGELEGSMMSSASDIAVQVFAIFSLVVVSTYTLW